MKQPNPQDSYIYLKFDAPHGVNIVEAENGIISAGQLLFLAMWFEYKGKSLLAAEEAAARNVKPEEPKIVRPEGMDLTELRRMK